MQQKELRYGSVRSVQELGELLRLHRKSRGRTLERLSGVGNVGVRFLSELERGKETAEIGKAFRALQLLGLEVVVVPRNEVPPDLRRRPRVGPERGG